MRYDLLEEIDMRLNNTIVSYNGEPHRVKGVYPAGQAPEIKTFGVALEKLPTGSGHKVFIVDQGDPLLTTKLSLGFINYNGTALYVSRSPVRKYRAGIYKENVYITDAKGQSLSNQHFEHFIKDEAFTAMVAGVYPSVEECMDSDWSVVPNGIGSACLAKAFNRHMSIIRDYVREDFLLVHKTQVIGFGCGRGGFKLTSSYGYLAETLQEKGVKCRA